MRPNFSQEKNVRRATNYQNICKKLDRFNRNLESSTWLLSFCFHVGLEFECGLCGGINSN